jgi:hypothetical protein
MAITVTSYLEPVSFAKSKMLIKIQSDRDDTTIQVVTGVTLGTGGYARFSFNPNVFKVADVVRGSSVSNIAYAVKMNVTAVNASWFETDLLFAGNATGGVRRENNNFSLKADVYVIDYSTQNNITSVLDAGGGVISIFFGSSYLAAAGQMIKILSPSIYAGEYLIQTVIDDDNILVKTPFIGTATGVTYIGEFVGSKSLLGVFNNPFPNDYAYTLNFSEYVYNALSSAPSATQTYFLQSSPTPWYKGFAVILTEKFDNKDGLQVSGDSYKNSSYRGMRAFNKPDDINVDSGSFNMELSAPRRFLTNRPKSTIVGSKEFVELGFLTGNTTTIEYYGKLTIYDINDSLLTPIQTPNTPIINYNGSFIFNTDALPVGAYKVEARVFNDSNTLCSEVLTFYYKNKCKNTCIVFENQFGKYDTFSIVGDIEVGRDVKKTSYRNYQNDTNVYGVSANDIHYLNSQVLSDEEAIWLGELIISPNVYIWYHDLNECKKIVLLNESQVLKSSKDFINISLKYVFEKKIESHNN